jgi:RNA polymerase sigma-70 factor (ECF subfamily)
MQPSGALKGLPMQLVDVVDAPYPTRPSSPCQSQPRALVSEGTRLPSSHEQASEVVALHFDFIWRLLRRLGVFEHEVDDAAQQVFLTATRKGLRGNAAEARPFLYGVALRVAANFRRTTRRRREVSEDAASEPYATGPAADDVADLRRARAILDQILDQMPIELRVVFLLSEIEQMTAASIAELEGIPPGTVASRLRRARELFRRHLAELGTCDPIGGHR